MSRPKKPNTGHAPWSRKKTPSPTLMTMTPAMTAMKPARPSERLGASSASNMTGAPDASPPAGFDRSGRRALAHAASVTAPARAGKARAPIFLDSKAIIRPQSPILGVGPLDTIGRIAVNSTVTYWSQEEAMLKRSWGAADCRCRSSVGRRCRVPVRCRAGTSCCCHSGRRGDGHGSHANRQSGPGRG